MSSIFIKSSKNLRNHPTKGAFRLDAKQREERLATFANLRETSAPVTTFASPPPPPQGFPTTTWLLSTASTRGPPRYPCSMSSHEVSKDSLKCSTCSKWVHFTCFSLTQANFLKICAADSAMGWNRPSCLNEDLASPTHQQASPCPVSPAPPPPAPPPPTCSDLMDSSLPLPSHPPHLDTYPLSAFTLPFTPPPPTSTQPIYNSPPHPQRTPRLPKTSEFYNGIPVIFPPHVVVN